MATGTQLEKSAPGIPGQLQWMDRLEGLMALMRVRWATMLPAQRRWALTTTALLMVLIGGLFWYGLRTDWRTLYADLDPEDARQTGQILAQALIPFDTTANGSGIRVPADQLDKARLVTAAKGGIKSGRLGFEIFDKPNWVGSEFDEQVNYQRALEGELEHTVGSLSDVQSARVHLVLTHDSLFREQERPAKASVVLKLRHRNLADGEPDAIRNLVASAVDGLTPDRVVLVDAAGHLPLGPKSADQLRLTAEEALEEKLVSTLEPVTGAGNVRASVTLDYDPAAIDETQETYDPNLVATLSMQRTDQTTGPQPVGDCVVETELGSVDLGIRSQLGEIERGFFDRAGGPRAQPAPAERETGRRKPGDRCMTSPPAMASKPLQTLQPLLGRYFARLSRGQPWRWRGQVLESVGQTIESRGPLASVGECCEIQDQFGRPHLAEVIGFRGANVLSMPVETTEGIRFGDPVAALGVHPEIEVGPALMGRVLNALGKPIDEGRPPAVAQTLPLDGSIRSPLDRVPIRIPLGTGIRVLDSLLTVGRGQRVGIFGGSGVGKRTLIGMMTRNTEADVGVAGSGGRGTIDGSSLEVSNVNISAEFSDLIVAQRAFEANSKAVTTFDTVTQETINMIH